MKEYRDEKWLRQKYHGEGLSCTEIADQCDVTYSTIHRSLQRNNIETRSQGTSDFGAKKYHDLDWLHTKFHDEGLSYSEIAGLCGVTKQTIYNSAKKVGLDTDGDTRYKDEGWFRREYIKKDRTLADIANECGVSCQHVIEWKQKHDIPTQYPSGEKHPNTKPESQCVTRERGEDWNRQRKRALERADYACENPDCDEDAESLGQNPDVHHIVPHRFHDEYDGINDLSNLVVLCRACHVKAEPPRNLNEVADEDDSVTDFGTNPRPGAA